MIRFINDKTWTITVEDMGIELQPNESINIENFTDKEIVESRNLKNSGGIFELDDIPISYDKMIKYIKKLSSITHNIEDTHAHNLRDSSFFDTEKVNGVTSKITYYTDATMTKKIRQEEIVRDNGAVSEIISRIYDDNEQVVETETQVLNRVGGRVDSINTTLEES